MEIRRVPITDLVLDPANARTHDDQNLAAISASLGRFDQVEPLVVQRSNGRVIGGNGRLVAMRQLGWTECDIVELDVDDLTATSLGIALNRSAELAAWDESVLAKLLDELRTSDALDGVGFDSKQIDELLAGLDEGNDDVDDPGPQEPLEDPVTESGDIWILGEHRLLCGDSTSATDVERLFAGAKPGLMISDPPYGVRYQPAWRNAAGLSDEGKTTVVTNDDRVDWTAAWRLFPGDVCYIWHAGVHAASVAEQLIDVSFEIRAQLIWRKPRFAISRGHYHWGHEPCWYAVRAGKSASWIGDRKQSTIWDIDPDRELKVEHATPKPLECMLRPMRNHSHEEVYDPFLGSGTTLIAAEQAGRRCLAMEIEPRFCDAAVLRWQQATGKEARTESGKTLAGVVSC